MAKQTHDAWADQLCTFARDTRSEDVPPGAIHAAKVRVVDSLAALLAGWDSDVARMTRRMAGSSSVRRGATVLGTRTSAPQDWAAFVNATTGRIAELNDTYHVPGKPGAHPSDALTPLLGIAEVERVSGRELLVALSIAYEVSLGLVDGCDLGPFDYTNLVALSVVLAGSRLRGMSLTETAAAVGICATSHNSLRRVRTGENSSWKAAASGAAGRAAVLSLAAADAGFDGPPQPFEGPHGWLGSIAAGEAHLTLTPETNEPWRITRSLLKSRGACGTVIPSILAAELAASSVADPRDIVGITVHTYRDAVRKCASGPHHWAPTTRETADHSIPFAVSAALVDGTASTHQFDQAHLDDPLLQALSMSVTVLEDPRYTARYESDARDHFTRVEVGLADGSVVIGEVGGDVREISDGMTDDEVQAKLEQAAAGLLPRPSLDLLAKSLWELEDVDDVSILAPLLIVDR